MLLTFEFKDIQEAKEFLEGLLGKEKLPGQVTSPAEPADKPSEPSKAPEPAVAEPKKRGRKPKAEKPIEIPAVYTIQDVRAKLQELFDTKGRQPLADILARLGAPSVGALLPTQYADAIQAADEALAA